MSELAADKDSSWSSLREEYVEYAFLGELCREFWRRDLPVDILRSHTDQSGFDIVMEAGAVQRHIQLKSSFIGAAIRVQKVNRKLEEKAGGCVVWIFFERETLAIGHYRWFGDACPNAPTPSFGEGVVKHTKGDKDGIKAIRPGQRLLNWGRFSLVKRSEELSRLLFPIQPPEVQGSLSA